MVASHRQAVKIRIGDGDVWASRPTTPIRVSRTKMHILYDQQEKEVKTIPLVGKISCGRSALVDDEDFEFLSKFRWHMGAGSAGYARRWEGTIKTGRVMVYMHVVVAERSGILTDKTTIDHKDTNKLNNRRTNLRKATQSQNQANCGMYSHNTSGVKGVSFSRSKNRYGAYIVVNNKQIWLGSFKTIEEARDRRRQAAVEHFGEYADVRDY